MFNPSPRSRPMRVRTGRLFIANQRGTALGKMRCSDPLKRGVCEAGTMNLPRLATYSIAAIGLARSRFIAIVEMKTLRPRSPFVRGLVGVDGAASEPRLQYSSPASILDCMTRQHFRLLTLFGLALLIGSAWADELIGRVVGVADGDTLTVLTPDYRKERVRLSGIDAPEQHQAFGQVSKQHLSDLVYGKTVTVDIHKRDHYKQPCS